ncbi:MAG TPA: endopeptidase La [Oligoflexia bacterium]|nr:endopeptidase La [Oligoflexia bacterium]HMP47806.1 endopeptidase La [Oligoflexia bacterium]
MSSQSYNPVPLIALRDIIIFPQMVVPLFIGREKSVRALEEAERQKKPIMLAAQREAKTHHPNPEDIFQVGTLGDIMQMMKLADGTVKVLLEGKKRARIENYLETDDYFLVNVEELSEKVEMTPELKGLLRSVTSAFESYVKLGKKISPEMIHQINAIDDPFRLADAIIVHLNIKLEDKQEILETNDATQRLESIYSHMKSEIEILQVEKRIRTRVKKQMEKTQKEYYLNEQMRAIQKELGEKDDFRNEIQELEDKLKAKDMPEDARDKTDKEIRKLKMMSPMSAEATVVRNYVDWMLSLPWNEYSEDKLELEEAETILDDDHYGLGRVKDRILEHLAVHKLVGKIRGPILCLVGPPGVGKTSLGKSIAKATGREFVRIALGGVRDEAEIRGHRRTYIGALPGKLVQSLKKAGKSNPVFLLDEIDKMSADFRGDPASALLEVLDPEQNNTFADHYLDVDYDLSNVMFITTANYEQNIPRPLLDRMELIRIAGYTELEKLQIGKKYLIPKSCEKNGLKPENIHIPDDTCLSVIRHYTREAGVRNLERTFDGICRKVAVEIVKNGTEEKVEVLETNLERYLGVKKFKFGRLESENQVGTVTGLAWTEVGGELLVIEVAVVPGRGRLMITGKLGDVMQESAQAAMMYVRSRSAFFGLPKDFYFNVDIHVHVPEGAIPKDGPSAGVAMVTAITSALTGVPVDRNIAMTGEITLRGRVLPIGGLKEKVLAAHRGGITRILIPKDNEKDIEEIPTSVRKGIEIITAGEADEVLREALVVENHEHFQKLFEEKSTRHERLFPKREQKKGDSQIAPGGEEDGVGGGLIAH